MNYEEKEWKVVIRGPYSATLYHDDDPQNKCFAEFASSKLALQAAACVNACRGINPEAVPLLLEALEWLVNLHHSVSKDGRTDIPNSEWIDAIESGVAAIAKARGDHETA